eukprot:s1340_g12.t1
MGSTAWTLAELRAHCCSCAKSHSWKQALAALEAAQSRSLQLEAVTLSATMTACNRASVWPMTLELLQMAGAAGAATVVVYNGALTACDKGHQWQMALQILSALTQQDLEPSSISYGATLSACRCGRWQEALWLLQETPEPNIILVNSAIAACAAKNDGWQFASLILYSSLCQRLQPTATTLTSTVRTYGLGEEWQKAVCVASLHPVQSMPVQDISTGEEPCEKVAD